MAERGAEGSVPSQAKEALIPYRLYKAFGRHVDTLDFVGHSCMPCPKQIYSWNHPTWYYSLGEAMEVNHEETEFLLGLIAVNQSPQDFVHACHYQTSKSLRATL